MPPTPAQVPCSARRWRSRISCTRIRASRWSSSRRTSSSSRTSRSSIATDWYNNGVDVVTDVPLSSAAFAIGDLAKQKDKVAIFTGAASADITGTHCGPNHCIGSTTPGPCRTVWWTPHEGRRQHLVLHHRRLRVRTFAAKGCGELRHRAPAARCWARRWCRSLAPRISPRLWCRRRPAAPRRSVWRMVAATR